MIWAGSRTPSIPVPLAVAATTRQIQTGPSVIRYPWINRLASEIIVGIRQDSGESLAVVLVVSTVRGLYSAGKGWWHQASIEAASDMDLSTVGVA